MKIGKIQLVLLAAILFIALITFKPLFSTALFGDDWQILWIATAPGHLGGTPLHTVANSYLMEVYTFNFLFKIFGFSSLAYYTFSFLLRVLVAFTLFWFLKRRKLSDMASFLGSTLFMVSPIGLEATIMIRNFDSYLGMILLLITFDIAFKLDSFKKAFVIIVLSIPELFINTIRAPGYFIAVCFFLFVSTTFAEIKNKKPAIVSILILTLILLIASTTSLFGGQGQNIRFLDFLSSQFFLSMMGNVGRSIVPYLPNELPPFIIISLCFLFWKRDYFFRKGIGSKIVVLVEILTILFIGLKIYQHKADFTNSILVGTFFAVNFILTILTEWRMSKTERLKETLIVLVLLISPLFTPILRNINFLADSEHRYLIFSALAIPIMVSFLFGSLHTTKTTKIKAGLFVLSFFLILSFILGTQNYLNFHQKNHNISYTNDVWGKLKSYLDKYDIKNNKVEIILLTNTQSYSKVNAVVHFGSLFHIGLIYGIWREDRLPTTYLIWNNEMLDKHLKQVSDPSRQKIFIEIIDTQVKEVSISNKDLVPGPNF